MAKKKVRKIYLRYSKLHGEYELWKNLDSLKKDVNTIDDSNNYLQCLCNPKSHIGFQPSKSSIYEITFKELKKK